MRFSTNVATKRRVTYTRPRKVGGLSLMDNLITSMRDSLVVDAKAVKENSENKYRKYRKDPVGFCTKVLRLKLTAEQCEICESVLAYKITEGQSANGVGKTLMASALAIWFLICFSDSGAEVYTLAAPPESNLKGLLWGEIARLYNRNKHLFSKDYTVKIASMSICRKDDPKSGIFGVTIPAVGNDEEKQARVSGKHAPFLLFIIDEADAVPAPIYKGIDSCMSGGFARLLLNFNPRQKAGEPYRLKKQKRARVIVMTAFTHPNVMTGEDIIPGAVTREVTLQRINLMTRRMRSYEKEDNDTFKVPKFLVGLTVIGENGEPYPPLPGGKRKVINQEFHHMVLGRYPSASEEQLIDQNSLERCIERHKVYTMIFGDVPPPVRPFISLDVADLGKDKNVETKLYGGYVPPQKIWNGIDANASANVLFDDIEECNAKAAWIDANGVGAAMPGKLKEKGFKNAYRIIVHEKCAIEDDPLGKFDRWRDYGFYKLAMWIKTDPSAMLPDDEELKEELLSFKINPKSNSGERRVSTKDYIKSVIGRSPDKAASLMMLFIPPPQVKKAGTVQQTNYGA